MAMKYTQRGLDREQEQNYRRLIRDVRTTGQKIADFYNNPEAVSVLLLCVAIATFFLPAFCDLLLLFGFGSFIKIATFHAVLPFRLPKSSGLKDYNSPLPGSDKPSQAAGIYYFGNEIRSNEELWFTNEDMRTHVLMFGSTGSGKTEALISISFNALIQSSGFIYVDGKGDNTLYSKIFSMVRAMGREDDLLLINFMTGARDIIGPQKRRLSNTMNPFAQGSSSMLSQLVIQLMDESSQNNSGDMWKGRAMAFVEALMKILVAMRDAEYILLDANVIRNYFSLERLEAMVIDKIFIRDGQESVNIESMPSAVLEPIANYVFNLPGYRKEQKGKQVSQVFEQHGYITMQLVRIFTSLADTYGHILRTMFAEVDLKDVVLNRRILAVLLPALEKSPEELSNLGKIIISSLKVMMAAGLGEEVEGTYADLVKKKPTNAKTPFLCVLDEYGYYAVKGFAVVPAQARSLGFSVIFAGQDLPALQKASKEEAATIGANTNIKICMKLEDPQETWDFFMKTAGESYVSHVGGFQNDTGSLTGNYADTKSAQLEKRSRIDLLDLKEQREGEAHILFKSRIVRSRLFFANPPAIARMRLNHFLKVGAPADSAVRALKNSLYYIDKFLKSEANVFDNQISDHDPDLGGFLDKFLEYQDFESLIDRSIKALVSFCNKQYDVGSEVEEEFSDGANLNTATRAQLTEDEIDIFTPMRLNDELDQLLILRGTDKATFIKPVLDYVSSSDNLKYINRMFGNDDFYQKIFWKEILHDLETLTYYPPNVKVYSVKEIDEAAGHVIEFIDNEKVKK